MRQYVDINDTQVIAPNFKKRLSGVTSTIVQLVPKQRQMGVRIAALAPDGLPDPVVRVRFRDLWRLWFEPNGANRRVWHARRNTEMLPGIFMRDVLRMKIRLLFTSAAQRDHRGFTKWLIRKMDAVIATSAQASSYLHVSNTVIMHGIDTERFAPADNKTQAKQALGFDSSFKLAGCFGRIRDQKGTDRFVHAMIKLIPDHPDWIAVVTGRVTADNKDFAGKLTDAISAAGLQDRIRFVGEVDDVLPWYQALDLFVAPQRWEGFGLTPLEAMACGVPVAATKVGAFNELIVNGATGLLTENDDRAIAGAVATLIENDALREEMAQKARPHVLESFMLEREAAQINTIYEKLLHSA